MNGGTRRLITWTAPVAVAAAAYAAVALSGDGGDAVAYRLENVSRGALTSAVSATGTLEAVVTVLVGSEVSGKIAEITADYNAAVRKDQVIARIDSRNFEADVRQGEAELAVAKANVQRAIAARARAEADLQNAIAATAALRADTDRAEAARVEARRDLDRKRQLVVSHSIPTSQRDTAEYGFKAAEAQLAAARARARAQDSEVGARRAEVAMAAADVAQAEAQVQKSDAALTRSRIRLDQTYIRAPVDGIVIERKVDVGQTVAASLSAPELFVIARNLSEMQVNASVDEADVGQVQVGQRAVFTVDSFPGREFTGVVRQVRKGPEVVQSVVSYHVIISAENPDLRLLPGMTANTRIIVESYDRALKVPNAALRFRPIEGDPAYGRRPAGAAAASERGGAEEAGPPGRGGDPRARIDAQIARLTQELGLDEAQQGQVRAIFAANGRRLRGMVQSGAGREDVQAARREMRAQTASQVRAVLGEAQRARYDALLARRATGDRRPATVWTLDPAGRALPVRVLAGASDGAFTRIVGEGLAEGQAVITGYSRAPAKARDSTRALRRGFGF